jgi:exopolysaccharide transport family protein
MGREDRASTSSLPVAQRDVISLQDRRHGADHAPGGSRELGDLIDAAFPIQTAIEEPLPGDQVDFAELLRRLWRRRWVIGATTVLATGIAAAVVSVLPARYAATAQVMVDARSAQVTDIKAVLPDLVIDKEQIQSEIEVLRSRRLAKNVIDQLGLARDPGFNPNLEPAEAGPLAAVVAAVPGLQQLDPYVGWLKPLFAAVPEQKSEERIQSEVVDNFLKSIDVAPEGQSRVLNVTAQSRTPEQAAGIANALVAAYLEDQVKTKSSATERASDWLGQRLDELRQEVERAESAVEQYRRDAGLVKGQQSTVVTQQLSELNTQLVIARANRTEVEARLRQVAPLLASPDQIEAVPEVLASPIVQNLLNQEAQLRRRAAELSSEFGPMHPRMTSLQAEIDGLRQSMELQVKQIVASLRNQLDSAIARERTLEANLASLQSQAGELNEKEVGLRALEREAAANRALLEQFLKRYKETSAGEFLQEPDARIVSEADLPLQPSFPKKKLMVMMAFTGSLGLGVLLALLLEHLDRGFRSSEQIERRLGMKTLALVPLIGSWDRKGRLLKRRLQSSAAPVEYVLDRPGSAFGEALRSLHTGLAMSNGGHPPKVVLFTSAQAQEGKSTTALSLGHLLAMHGDRVIVVDADLRHPQVAKRLELPPSPGLVEVLNKECQLSQAIYTHPRSGLHALPAGGPALSPQELFKAQALQAKVFDQLAMLYDLVIVDGPPILPVSDSKLLCRMVDKTIFMIRWGETRPEVAIAGLKQLRDAGADLAGVVLSLVDARRHADYAYGDSAYYQGSNLRYYTN